MNNALHLTPGTSQLIKLTEIFDQIRKGNILLPEFQRSYNWSKNEKENLLFSMFQSITIGSIILWRSNDSNGNINEPKRGIGKFISSNQDPDYMLLDGQQRFTFLTSLYVSATENKMYSEFPEYYIDIVADPVSIFTEPVNINYHGADRMILSDCTKISIQRLIKCQINEIENIPQITSHQENALIKFKNSLSEKEIPSYYFESDRSKALFVYESANMTGKRLKKEDLMEAILTNQSADLAKNVNSLIHTLANSQKSINKFPLCSKTNVYRAISTDIFQTYEAKPKNLGVFKSIKPNTKPLTSADVDSSFKRCKKSIEVIVNALRDDLKIKNGSNLLLPTLIVSIIIFNKYIQQISQSRIYRGKFLRWFILSNKNKHYTGGSTNTKVDDEIKAVLNSSSLDDLFLKLDDLMVNSMGGRRECLEFNWIDFGSLDQKSKSNIQAIYSGKIRPHCKDEIIMLLRLVVFSSKANDWFSDHYITSETSELHHIWPKNSFKTTNCTHYNKLIDHPANLALITKASNRYISSKQFADYIDLLYNSADDLNLQGVYIPQKKKHKTLNPQTDSFFYYCEERSSKLMKIFNGILDNYNKGIFEIGQKSKFERDCDEGESEKVEFKSSAVYDYNLGQQNDILKLEIVKTVNAFGNSSGGTLYIGVDDNSNIIGLDEDLNCFKSQDDYLRWLTELVKKGCGSSYSSEKNRCPFIIRKIITNNGKIIFGIDVFAFENPRTEVTMTREFRKLFQITANQKIFFKRSGPRSEKNILI